MTTGAKAKKKARRQATAARARSKPRTKKPQWPAEAIERRKVEDLVLYAKNARVHSDVQVAQLVASIKEWGWTTPVLIDEKGGVIAGHGRLMAAGQLGINEVPCMVARGWTKTQKRAYAIADNQLALQADWDMDLLRVELGELQGLEFDLSLLAFDDSALASLLEPAKDEQKDLEKADEFDAVKEIAITEKGDLWLLGDHRVLCGDSTIAKQVTKLMDGRIADMIHADPPYGMGKESEGIANDNLYNEKLDAFQIKWLKLAMRHAQENCGIYIWGNAADLWRLWYEGKLQDLDKLYARNEIVWAKGSGFGMSAEHQHSYSIETERCLFLMRGQQFLGSQNKDDYWEGYEPIRLWMVEQLEASGWTAKDVNQITSSHMAGHWFRKSQFYVINRTNYDKLRKASKGKAFAITYEELVDQFSDTKQGGNAYRRELSAQMREIRSYFDNTHEPMTDVWHYGRVFGEERFGHATPKPAKMIGRTVKSSCPEDGLVLEPFLGTGTTLIAAELLNRHCFGLELEPLYVDVIVRRWEQTTGRAATLEASGDTFGEVAHARGAAESVLS